MIKTLFFLLALTAFVPVSSAQDNPKPSPTAEAPSAETLRLAEKMHEIWPIRIRMENALDSIAENFPVERRDEVRATMRKSIQFDQLEEESIKAMASIFTEDELKAMIEFYGSETGKSISAKTGDYEMALRPVIGKMLDKAIADLRFGNPENPQ